MAEVNSNLYYVYVFLDQRKSGLWVYSNEISFNYQPFYVGVGRKYRIKAHFKPKELERKNIKNNIIKKITSEVNALPLHYKIIDNLNHSEAIKIERNFILYFGRICNKTGILSNITEGGEGNVGLVHTEEFLETKRRKVYQYSLDGNFITEHKSEQSACKAIGVKCGCVREAIKRKGSCGNYQWRRELEYKIDSYVLHIPKKRYIFVMLKDNYIVKEFFSKTEIEVYLQRKVSFGNISSCCSGKLKSYLGYDWFKYKK